jgi:hypothetical protein
LPVLPELPALPELPPLAELDTGAMLVVWAAPLMANARNTKAGVSSCRCSGGIVRDTECLHWRNMEASIGE